jgi:hypothetical protein
MRRFAFVLWILPIALAATALPVRAQQRQLPIVRPALVAPSGPITITMPDGSTLSGATNQLLVFLSGDVTTANRQAVADTVTAAGAQVVGELSEIKMLQVQVQNPTTVGALILKLRVLTGVSYVGPNLFEAPDDAGCSGIGPNGQTTGWVQADHLAPAPASANDVIIGIVDDFAVPGQTPSPALAQHGDVVAAYAQDAGGKTPTGAPLFQLGKNIFEIPAQPTNGASYEAVVRQLMANNPGKKVVLNLSRGPAECNRGSSPDLDSTDDTRRNKARADCAASRNEWDKKKNAFAQSLVRQYGDRVILVNSAGNIDVSLEPSTSLSSCHFIPVGGLDQTSPRLTTAPFTTVGAPIPVYAPACNISPVSLKVDPNTALSSGTSFAAPQIAGQLAAIWASNPGLTGCQLGSQIFALPKPDPTQTGALFDGQALGALASAHGPALDLLPSPLTLLECPAISVTPGQSLLQVNQTVRLTPKLASGGTATFRYLSSNPTVATVDANGLVTVKAPGVSTVSVTAPNQLCAAQASVMVPAERYSGTFLEQLSATLPNDPDWSPNPITITGSANGTLTLTPAQSLLTIGTFAGFLTAGPGTASVTVPTMTCVACKPPSTVPGFTDTEPFPESSIPITGTSDGKIILIPIEGYPAMTGTVSVLGSTVQVTLSWSVQISDAVAGTIVIRLNGTMTKQ